MSDEREGVLPAAAPGLEICHEHMHEGIERLLRPDDEGKLLNEEVPVAAASAAVEEHGQPVGRCLSVDRSARGQRDGEEESSGR